MQSPAKPYGCRGCVTATKHIGLDSFRVRNCDPGADDRLPIHRASRCWKDDLEFGCHKRPLGFRASSRLIVATHDSDRRPTSVESVEPQVGFEIRAQAATPNGRPLTCGSADLRRLHRSSSFLEADSGPADIERAVHPSGSVCASGRIPPFSDLFRPYLSWSIPLGARDFDDAGRSPASVRRQGSWWPLHDRKTARALILYTLTRVSDEKRNADERPPTGGKSDCHR